MSRLLVSAFALSTLLGACALEDDDDIWMPPSADGKADGVSIIKGNTIPSQYVSATKDYLTGRVISSLGQVGALAAGDDYAVAMRADGIIANLPANGRLEAAELARMENPQIFATLFPNEQAALPHLWPLLEAPSGPALPVAVPGADLTMTDQSTAPGGLTPPPFLPISSLEGSWQQVAQRVQLVFDADADATTIHVADIQKVLADPQAFTPGEVYVLDLILAEFHKRATSFEEAKVVMPEPGVQTKHTQVGAMAFDFATDVVIHEQRYYSTGASGSWQGYNVGASMTVEATSSGGLAAPATDKLILISLGDGKEQVLAGGPQVLAALPVGSFVLERYTMGVRQESFLLALPGFKPGLVRADASNYVDYLMVTASGAPLVKNAIATTSNANTTGGSTMTADYHHELAPNVTPGLNQNVLGTLVTPWTGQLPMGRYEATFGTTKVALDLYPQRVAILTVGTQSARMRLGPVLTLNPYEGFSGTAGTLHAQWAPSNLQLIVWLNNHETPRVTLTPAMRTK